MADAWNALNAKGANLPFLDAEVITLAQRVFGAGSERLALGRANGRIIAAGLICRIDSIRWITFQPSQLPLGAWVCEPSIDIQVLSDSLLKALPGLALVLSITQMDPRTTSRSKNSGKFRTDDYIETGWIPLEGSFDEYWTSRGKQLRQNMRTQRNKINAENIGVEMRTYSEPAQMADAVARYGDLESQGWKAKEGTAIHRNNEQGAFYTELLTLAAHAGEAQIYEYLFDGKLVASNLCIRRGDIQVMLKTTYDESYKQISPAFLLLHDQLQALFSEGIITRYEFFGRVWGWTTRWTDQKRTLYHLTTYRNGLIRKLADRRRQASDAENETSAAPA